MGADGAEVVIVETGHFTWQSTDPAVGPAEAAVAQAVFWAAFQEGCEYLRRGDDLTVRLGSDPALQAPADAARPASAALREYLNHPAGGSDVIAPLPLLGSLDRRLVVWRDGGAPFTKRDVLLMSFLRPHLAALHQLHRQTIEGVPALTARQWEILGLVAAGRTNRQIARELMVSEGTVRTHLEHVYGRLEVNSRTAALAKVTPFLGSTILAR
jgi:DNA-binding CsgD family transcriptional regulator